MFEWHKKELPFFGMMGFGGGIASKLIGGGTLQGLTATGGVISEYTDGPTVYRAHIFTSSGTFSVSEVGDYPAYIDYLVVGGGGAGGQAHSANGTGGGGAGGLRTNIPSCPYAQAAYPVSIGNYTVVVGGGGAAIREPDYSRKGSYSELYPTPGGTGSGIYASGGGAGGGSSFTPQPEQDGGSGGGEDTFDPDNYIGSTLASPDGRSPTTQGFAGGADSAPIYQGGGGGGAGQAGNTNGIGYGGDGLQILIAEPPATPAPTRTFGANGGYFGGGGGGNDGPAPGTSKPGGLGGGGGNSTPGGGRGTFATGGGGGGNFDATPAGIAGSGGSGIVVVRYRIGETGTAKATGGAISYYNDKTIHIFLSSGTFTVTNPSLTSVEYVVVAGGGGGGGTGPNIAAGGGGAGGYRTGTGLPVSPGPYSITVGAGGVSLVGSPSGNGSSSIFSTITSTGGGAGGTDGINAGVGAAGGSGGGGGHIAAYGTNGGAGNTPPTSPSQGNPGFASDSASGKGGGGGGAGAGGPVSTVQSPAGIGVQVPSTFQNPTSTIGTPGPGGLWYVSGGGGGGATIAPNAGLGGAGGGGNAVPGSPINGTVNTGGGGAGQPTAPQGGSAGLGGSGIVIIAYPT